MQFKAEYYVVMEALTSGVKTVDEIAAQVDMERHDVETILNSLAAYGLVEKREKGLIFKKEAYGLSERGWEVLAQWREEVRSRVERAIELRGAGRVREAEAELAPIQSILPALLAMGMIDMALWGALHGVQTEDFDAADVDVEL